MSKYILILFLLISIYCNDDIKNKTENTTKKVIDSKKPFNITIDEIDTMMVCAIIMEEKIKKYSSKIEYIQKKLNVTTPELLTNKISADIFEKCNKLLTIKEVNKYIKNLTFVGNFEWEKNFDKISEINFDKYKNISDLEYTVNQQVLMYNFQKAEEVFKQKQMEDRERYIKANQKIKIGNLDLENIPQGFKLGIFLIIFLIFFGTIFYYLKGLNKKLGANSKKKKKKTQ
jgi:hypothetical protein